jgi:hypothetical protein
MENIMSKNNDSSAALKEPRRTLDDAELEAVSGGFFLDIGTAETLDLNMVGPSRRV